MKIGVLECDNVEQQYQPQFGDYPDMFKHLMEQADPSIKLVFYDARAGVLPQHLDECDGYMTTGSRYGANDGDPWMAELEDFIRELHRARKKLVGICFGHQLMAKALGGAVERSAKGWGIGVRQQRVITEKPWMQPTRQDFRLLVSHQDQVSELPEEAEVLAASDFCPFYMLGYGDHFLSIQGHPEFSKGYSRALSENRRDRIPADVIQQGLMSLEDPVDSVLIGQWISNFYR